VRPEDPAAELSPGARTWLAVLIGSLSSDDEMVRRSAVAGIAALGPAALPALRAARANAAGTLAEDLDRAIARMAERPGGAPGGRGGEGGAPGGPGGAGARRFGGLDMQKQFLVENLDLTAEQTTALDAAIAALREREAELQKLREAGTGDPGLMREGYRTLMEDLRKALDGILTPEQAAKLQELRESRGRRPR
jgi:Spy/CpxP family protein refolding chaperone